MSDVVRAKLAEALRQHGDSSLATWANERICLCDCMYRVMPPGPDFCDHLADVLLSLEGVTIVALPPPDSTRYEGDEHEPQDRLCWGPGDDFEVSVWDRGEVQRHGYGWGDSEPLSVNEARTIASWLLAAADAAEAVKQ